MKREIESEKVIGSDEGRYREREREPESNWERWSERLGLGERESERGKEDERLGESDRERERDMVEK